MAGSGSFTAPALFFCGHLINLFAVQQEIGGMFQHILLFLALALTKLLVLRHARVGWSRLSVLPTCGF